MSTIPAQLSSLSDLIDDSAECLLNPNGSLERTALLAAKYLFDHSLTTEKVSGPHINLLLQSLHPSEAPQTRSMTRKRKRGSSPVRPTSVFPHTPLSSLFIESMGSEQIWEQLELRTKPVCTMLQVALEGAMDPTEDPDDAPDGLSLEMDEDDLDDLSSGDEDGDVLSEGDDSEEGEDDDDDAYSDEEANQAELVTTSLREDLEGDSSEGGEEDLQLPQQNHASSHRGVDDQFFNLSSFNHETDLSEAKGFSGGRLDEDSDDDNVSVDLFAPIAHENFDEENVEIDGGAAFYKDFFDPPRKRQKDVGKQAGGVRFHDQVKVKAIKAKGRGRPVSSMHVVTDDNSSSASDEEDEEPISEVPDGSEDDTDIMEEELRDDESSEEEDNSGRKAMQRMNNDLFAADEEVMDDEGMSTHQKRLSSLREQIAALETENVGQKDWVLLGEADSRARPQNSLLEEDLDFERLSKVVPVITESTVQDLEELIKARILERRFDNVIRLRPVEDRPFLPSRFFELSDTKSKESLSQIYENEYVAAQSEVPPGAGRDGKLAKEHEELDKLWEGICHKLDALCNAHFIPKQPKGTIVAVENLSTVSLESALPTSNSVSRMLAPEEVFVPSSLEARAKSEMTPSDKKSARLKIRKAKKKQRDILSKGTDKVARKVGGKPVGGAKKEKEAALRSIVKPGKGVTVVGKEGLKPKRK